MSFWIDGPAETDEQRVAAWRQELQPSIAGLLAASTESFTGDYSPGSLADFETFVLWQLPELRSMTDRAAVALVRPLLGYLGEALMWAGGGRWIWGTGVFAGMPCVEFDAALGLAPVSPLLHIIKAVRIRDYRQFTGVLNKVESAVVAQQNVQPGWSVTKAETPGLAERPGSMGDSSDPLVALVVAVMQQRGYECEVGKDTIAVSGEGVDDGWVLHLENLRRKVAAEPQDQWPALVADHLGSWFAGIEADNEVPIDFNDFQQLRSMLRTRLYPEDMSDPGFAVISRPLAHGLSQRVVIDQVNTIASLTRERLARWPVSEDELFALAEANTREDGLLEFEDNLDPQSEEPQIGGLLGNADYTSAHVRWLNDYPVVGRWGTLFIVPHEGAIFVHEINSMDALIAVGTLAKIAVAGYADRPSPVSPHVYRWSDGVIELAAATHQSSNSLELRISESFQSLVEELPE